MANRLKMAKIDAILHLHQQHWSIRRIAKELGVSRKAVAQHIRLLAAIVKGCQGAHRDRRHFGGSKRGHPTRGRP